MTGSPLQPAMASPDAKCHARAEAPLLEESP